LNDCIAEFFAFPPEHALSEIFSGACTVYGLPGVIDHCLRSVDGRRIDGKCHPSVELDGAVFISAGSQLGKNVTVQGPSYIGPGAQISPGVSIRPGSWIGANVQVGRGSEIKRVICLDNAKIASSAFVGDSILGFGARVGSGAVFANRRFDQKHVALRKEDGTRCSTEQPFFGAILGDYVRIGANAVLCPGTVVGAYSWVGPGVVLSGNLPSAQSVFVRQDLVVKPIARNRLCDNATAGPVTG
jgi:UDP-N-acetylglucosamine diphosphorylase / glucose-1-phosphate thymidylyltransferase / UDP-N-acetylgalactosamine diphosphorylase / glucosamine-1-phosphate N-acetyltransferase / galactosamine-1-phosphate N-acetyltransferase